jgi:acyl dehydratase
MGKEFALGLYLEEFEIGRTYTTRGRTVGEGDISQFAGLVGDFNPLHVDAEFCKDTRFGERIAHGPLTMSMAIGLMAQLNLIDGTALGLLNLGWDFQQPVKIGDTVSAKVTVTEKRAAKKPGSGVLRLQCEVLNQRRETVQVGTVTLLMKMRGEP